MKMGWGKMARRMADLEQRLADQEKRLADQEQYSESQCMAFMAFIATTCLFVFFHSLKWLLG